MYAIGGKDTKTTVERFDGREGKWFSLTSTLIDNRFYHGVAVLDSYIYCTGGCKLYHTKNPSFTFNLFDLKSFLTNALEILKKAINFNRWTRELVTMISI